MAIRILVPPDALRVGAIAVRGDEHIYVGRVRRAAVGDAVRVFDGNGRAADATIAAMETLGARRDDITAVDVRGTG